MKLSCYEAMKAGKAFDAKEVQMIIKTLKQILKKGGVVAVSENDTLITAYHLNSYDRRGARDSSYSLNNL